MSKKGFTYTLQIDAEINDLIQKTNQVKKSMESVMAAGKAPGAEKVFRNIEQALEKLQQKASQPIESVSAFTALEKDSALVGVQLKKLGSIIEGLGGMEIQDKMDLIPADLAQKIGKASAALKAYKTAEAEASEKTEENLLNSKRLAKAKEEEAAALEKANTKQKLYTMQSKTAEAAKAEVDAIKRKIEALKEYQAAADEVRKKEGDTADVSKAVPIGKIKAAQQAAPQLNLDDASAVDGEIEQLAAALATASKNATAASATLREYQTALDKANNTWFVASEKVEELDAEQKRLDNDFENNKAKKMQTAYSALRQEADKLGIDLTEIPIEYTEQNFIKLNAALNQLTVDGIAKVDQNVNNLQSEFDETNATAENFSNTMQSTGKKVEKLDETVSNVTAFTERIKQFVGLQGAAMIARRALSDAIQTVKELDEVMTEMAVVTDAGIGDYWSQLSEHTDRANDLGLAIKDVYKAETLYYQQGLKTNEVVAMSTETLKMARIAGLSAEDATDKMTAALRGFNMELNETSAQKVADVYSELAAITASDVNEISSAMTKTASIASSAGMEFETTAAFLSQIIETTRESAETAGTAMKTVIARFQELKKAPGEIGEVDGEIVDANKIETALRTVGVSLRDARGQFRDLDEVFLELSSKWDGLDTNTQRYIATIAAGSRQQSRFIAMMSDYSRTTELVTAANTSAGASQQQFEKTMDSLESKLNQLKNAWSEFTMGIMDSSFLKFGVDVLTTLLNIINNITAGIGKAGGMWEKFTGGLSKIGVIVTIVKVGEALVNKLFSALTQKATALGKAIGDGIVEGTTKGLATAKQQVEQAEAEQKKPPQNGDTGPVQEEMKKKSAGIKGVIQGTGAMFGAPETQTSALEGQLQSNISTGLQSQKGKSLAAALKAPEMPKVSKKAMTNMFPEAGWKTIENQFRRKMKKMGKTTEEIDEAWQKTSSSIGKKGVKAIDVVEDLDKQLGETAKASRENGQEIPKYMETINVNSTLAGESVAKVGEESKKVGDAAQIGAETAISGYDQLSTSMTNVGMAVTGIGMACGAVGSYFEGMGLQGVADAFNGIGTAVTTVGGIMTGIGGVLTLLKPMFASTIAQAYAIAAGKTVESAGWFASAVGAIAAQTAMSPVLVITLLITAAILLLVLAIIALVAIFKAIKNSTPEAKLEKARESAEAAANAADQATESFKTLKDTLDSLEDKYSALDELTRGTDEWKRAVQEINGEISALIEQYPELAAFVERDANGVLTIDVDSAEVQGVLREYENKTLQAKAASIAADINVREKEADVNRKNAKNKIGGTSTTDDSTGSTKKVYQEDGSYVYMQQTQISDTTMDALSQAISGGALSDDDGDGLKDEITAWLQQNGADEQEKLFAAEFATTLAQATDELREFGNSLDEAALQNKLAMEQMAQNAIDGIDASNYSQEELTAMSVAGTAEYAESFNTAYQDNFQKMLDQDAESSGDETPEELVKAKEEVAKNLYGEDATINGNKITYKDEEGKEQTKELTDEGFKEQWAAIQATKDMTAAFEQLPKTINKIANIMTEEAGDAFRAMYKGEEGKAMTKEDIEAGKYSKDAIEAIWNELSEEEKKAYGSFENLWQQYENTYAKAGEALAQTKEAFKNAGLTDDSGNAEVLEGVTMEAAMGYAEQMRNIFLMAGDAASEVTQQLTDQFNNVTANLNDTDKTSFVSALNALDWNSVESLESLPDILKQMGISVPNDELDKYIDLLIESAGAVKEIDVEQLKEAALELANLKKDLESGQQGRKISEDMYETLSKVAPEIAEQFQQSLDGEFVFLGTSLDALTDAVKANTEALMAEAIEQAENKLAMINAAEAITVTQGNKKLTVSNMNDNAVSRDSREQFLKGWQEMMTGAGAEIIGIPGFGNNTDVSKMSDKEISDVFTSLMNTMGERQEIEANLFKDMVSNASLYYQTQSSVNNAVGAGTDKKYENMSTNEQLDFQARSNTLQVQATDAGVSEKLIKNYATLVQQFKDGTASLEDLNAAQDALANATDYANMRKTLEAMVASAGEAVEAYNQLADSDFRGKIALANDALGQFGIEVTEAADADMYIELLSQVSQGSQEALATLVNYAATAAGMTGDVYREGFAEMGEEQKAFLDQMQAAGLGFWEKTGDSMSFVWANAAELASSAEKAGNEIEAWEDSYGWIYNYNEELNRLIREREKAERAYTRALEDETKSASELLAISKEQLSNLQQEAALQQAAIERATAENASLFEANSEFADYVQYDATTGSILIDSESFAATNPDEDTAEKFDAFVAAITENRDTILDAQDALYDIEDEISEIGKRGQDNTANLYNQIRDGLVQSRQEEIDKLDAINNSVQEASNSLVAKIQEQINDARQARDNEKAANEISDKETRLAYLMRDTSGANAMEIAALQKEIAEQKEGYTDSLVDQSLQDLQDANEKAAEQRQQQIELMQMQLDSYSNSQDIWQEVQHILLASLTEAQASGDFSTAWMTTSAAQFISIASGLDTLNPIEQGIAAVEMTQDAKLSALYTGVSALNTQQAAEANAAIQSGLMEQMIGTAEGANGLSAEQKAVLDSTLLQLQTSGTIDSESLSQLQSIFTQLGMDSLLSAEQKTQLDNVFAKLEAGEVLSKEKRDLLMAVNNDLIMANANDLTSLLNQDSQALILSGIMGNLAPGSSLLDALSSTGAISNSLGSVNGTVGAVGDAVADSTGATNKLDGDLQSEAESTRTSVSGTTAAIENILEQAGTFGKIAKSDVDNALDLVRGDGTTLAGLKQQQKAAKKNYEDISSNTKTSADADKNISLKTNTISTNSATVKDNTNSMFKKDVKVDPGFDAKDLVGEDKKEDEPVDKVSAATHTAIQNGINAVSTGGGGFDKVDGKGSAAYEQAYTDWVKAGNKGSKEDFDKAIKNAMKTGTDADDVAYDINTGYYNSGTAQIETGDFPGAWCEGLGNGTGKCDECDVVFNDGTRVKGVQVGRQSWGTQYNLADDTAAAFLDKQCGGTPQTGYLGMINGQPYIFNDKRWRYINKDYSDSGYTELRKAMLNQLNGKQYKTGGLADYTGPAWLDGTKSKPEMVLNQTDTANFIQLKDILADILHGTSTVGKTDKENKGDNYYDIEINVEKIEDDYDVEQLAEKIRTLIYEDSVYRNVNLINNIH